MLNGALKLDATPELAADLETDAVLGHELATDHKFTEFHAVLKLADEKLDTTVRAEELNFASYVGYFSLLL
ncbi:hypothetical protein PF002_g23809 [Phytophthora fragariae]|uniref:Uncharacterized protein n=1 Tax=Phytophthora fragariae TaxID=53985 RepID=A0A6A3IHS6_9STRA|nr:hypothetical protein PF011_g21559 [Phytophthora fragariae]KAE9193744.1 hypothetical protein PF002_g23809 [Phytophthora fragariae]